MSQGEEGEQRCFSESEVFPTGDGGGSGSRGIVGLYIVGTVQFLLIVSRALTISTLGYVRKLSTPRVTLNSALDNPLNIHRSTSTDVDSLGKTLRFFSYHFSYYRM